MMCPAVTRETRSLTAVSVFGAVFLALGILDVPDGVVTAAATPLLGQEPAPTLRSGVDLVIIEVQLAVADSRPIATATKDFQVKTDGRLRQLLLAEFLHSDDGPVVQRTARPRMDQTTHATCIFAFERTSNLNHAHYRLGIEPMEFDNRGIRHVVIKLNASGVKVQRWAWRVRPVVPAESR